MTRNPTTPPSPWSAFSCVAPGGFTAPREASVVTVALPPTFADVAVSLATWMTRAGSEGAP